MPELTKITVELSSDEAYGLSQVLKRLNRSNIGRRSQGGLDLAMEDEVIGAELALLKITEALREQGWDPR